MAPRADGAIAAEPIELKADAGDIEGARNPRDGGLPGRNGTLGADILLRRTIEFSC